MPSFIQQLMEAGEAKVCNCRRCRKPLLGESHTQDYQKAQADGPKAILGVPEPVYVRFDGVPLCGACVVDIYAKRVPLDWGGL